MLDRLSLLFVQNSTQIVTWPLKADFESLRPPHLHHCYLVDPVDAGNITDVSG